MSSVGRTADSKTQTYSFAYDSFGNMTSLKVGNWELAEYTYAANNGLLTKQEYGNGDVVSFTYDDLGRIKTTTCSDGRVLTHSYTGDGQVYSVVESGGPAPATYLFTYDTLGRLVNSEKRSGSSTVLRTSQTYNANNQLTRQAWQMGGTTYTQNITYDTHGRVLATSPGDGTSLILTYDSLSRLSTKTGETFKTIFLYADGTEEKTTTTRIAEVEYARVDGNFFTGETYGYTYDASGNIVKITKNGVTTNSYAYDNQGQLTQANGISYTYDDAGNILTVSNGTTTHTYAYENANWKDLLTKYDGETISYDNSGNPTSYYNGTRWTFDWTNGRSLVSATDGETEISYVYDKDGLRTSKTVDGVVHNYIYASGKLLRETYGSNVLDFFYDENGAPYAMKYNGVLYYYVTNLQGDVIRLVDVNGTTKATYSYGPYGSTSASNNLANVNPLRYRSYYYDSETGFYYLQSRYYDPEIGRFINADGYAGTGQGILGYNMFVYCNNSPVINSDMTGERMVSAFNPELGGNVYNSADRTIIDNKDEILSAAEKYGVDPYVLAGCIYVEQYYNYDFFDVLTDVPLFFMDTSVGIAQVKISTVCTLEENGYVEKVGHGFMKNWQVAYSLQNDSAYNINCAAAYLSYLQMRWDGAYDVSTDPAIWGTLYNMGERTPHSNPQSNWFGNKVNGYYWYMQLLLG